jgi:hypothetical protein
MAPEMVIDRQYDGRKADLWSVGCILLELLLTAKEFSTMWMKNFQVGGFGEKVSACMAEGLSFAVPVQDEFMEDPVRFKRQLYSSWSQLEGMLKGRVSEDLFGFVTGLLKVDPALRLSSHDLQRASRSGPPKQTKLEAASLDGASGPAKMGHGAGLGSGAGLGAFTTHAHAQAQTHGHGATPMVVSSGTEQGDTGGSKADRAYATGAGATGGQPTQGKGARSRGAQKQSARNTLRAQTLLKLENLQLNTYLRGRNPGIGPLSPGTPDIGVAKKFFVEESDKASSTSPMGGQPSATAASKAPAHAPSFLATASSSSSSISSQTSSGPYSPSGSSMV